MVPLIFLAALISYYRLAYPLLNDNDVPWHIATGQLLLATRHLPDTDPWAFGNQAHPWFILSWVWDLLLGIVRQSFGELGMFIFTLAIGAGLTAGVAARLLKLDIALPAVLMTAMLTGLCLLDYITARPQLAGYMLAFAFHAILHKSRPLLPPPAGGRVGVGALREGFPQSPPPQPSPLQGEGVFALLFLPPLMLLWVNSHGSFMVGFIIMGAYAVEAWFTRRRDWLKRIVLTGAACALCALVNPYGPQVALGALLSLNSPATRYTAEWLPFSFATSTGLSLWLLVFILSSNIRSAGVSIADKILAMGWLLATLFSIRNGAFFILMSAPYLATCLDEQTRDLRKPQPESPLSRFMNRQKLRRVWLTCAGLFVALCALAYALPHDDKIQSEEYSANDAIDYALTHYPDHHFYTDYNLGGQVIYRTQGRLSYFMDSRASTAYDPSAVEEFMGFLKLDDGWEERLRARHLNGLLIGQNTNFAEAYDKGRYHDRWKLVFAGKRANVYVLRK